MHLGVQCMFACLNRQAFVQEMGRLAVYILIYIYIKYLCIYAWQTNLQRMCLPNYDQTWIDLIHFSSV